MVATLGAALWLGTACNAGRMRESIGDQFRAISDRLRGASPRERYADDLRSERGDSVARGWVAAGDRALDAPAAAPIPLREQGVLSGAEPVALAWRVRARRGERVTARVDADADSGARVFTELWREDPTDPTARRLIASGDHVHAAYDVPVDDATAVYVLRLQAEWGHRVRWDVTLGGGPSLAFPVQGKDVRAIESGFGAPRDGGARPHEGVDIMAPRGTPAVAAEDGVVGYVGDDRLGGHVVSVEVPSRGHSLYYAHRDTQAVHTGQIVHAGDTVGYVGNTGNARGGPTHLHFGIYTSGGAVDPLPYLGERRRLASAPGRDTAYVGRAVRIGARSAVALRAGPVADAQAVTLLAPRTVVAVDGAAGGGWLHVRVPDAAASAPAAAVTGYISAGAVERISE